MTDSWDLPLIGCAVYGWTLDIVAKQSGKERGGGICVYIYIYMIAGVTTSRFMRLSAPLISRC